MNGQMEQPIDGMDGKIDWVDRRMDGQTDVKMDRYGWTKQTDSPTGRTDGWTGRTDRQIYRLADGWTDRWTHGMERHGRNKRTDDGLIDKRLHRVTESTDQRN